MAAKRKPNLGASKANASAEVPPSTDNTLVPTNNNEDQGEDHEIEDLTDGEFEVDLHNLGISAEDILAMKRIDARLTERLRHRSKLKRAHRMRRWQQDPREKGMSSLLKS